jgi:hypothetical protein
MRFGAAEGGFSKLAGYRYKNNSARWRTARFF